VAYLVVEVGGYDNHESKRLHKGIFECPIVYRCKNKHHIDVISYYLVPVGG
jgi:hypothetical protein